MNQRSVKKPAHVIVLGNEKGGSGKSTLAIHVAMALLKAGKAVGTIDLDTRQRSLTHFLENRIAWSSRLAKELIIPTHITIANSLDDSIVVREEQEFAAFAEAVGRLEYEMDYLVLDTPGHDNYLCRLGHSMADTLITPVNDSFVDLDVLGRFEAGTGRYLGESQYSLMVKESRRRRKLADGGDIDWIVVRNRLSSLDALNKRCVQQALKITAKRVGFRTEPGLGERVIFREMFTRGLTLFDMFDDMPDTKPSISLISARKEIGRLINRLELPDNAVAALAKRTVSRPEIVA